MASPRIYFFPIYGNLIKIGLAYH